jgi:aminopeptidase
MELYEHYLDSLAKVAVHVGLGLQEGQELLITAPIEAVPLVRKITEYAYKAGSPPAALSACPRGLLRQSAAVAL